MAKVEVGFYYRVTVHVEVDDVGDALNKAVGMHLEVTAVSNDDPNVDVTFVECMDPDITEIKEE